MDKKGLKTDAPRASVTNKTKKKLQDKTRKERKEATRSYL